MWDNRFSWSGEIPLTFPGLNPVALQRVAPQAGVNYTDAVTTTRRWQRITGGANDGYVAGQWGLQMGLNSVNPATDNGGFQLLNFAGLWPSSGKLLMGLWVRQNYVMAHSPLMSTRGGSSPLAYIATTSTGRLRHQVYNAAGASVLDQYEDHPWVKTSGWQFVGQLLDMTAQTSRMFSVELAGKRSWIGPVRNLTGAPNPASTANLDVFALPSGNVWTMGIFDEAIIAHPGASFDLAKFVDQMALGLWSDGQITGNADHFTLTESSIRANSERTLSTGAERVSWNAQPIVQGMPAGSTPYWSTNEGLSWSTGALPAQLNGILRWTVPLGANQTFSGATVTVPSEPPPTLGTISNISMEQGDIANVPLTFTNFGAPRWVVSAPSMVTVSIVGNTMSVAAGFNTGVAPVTVTLIDELDRSVARSFNVTVNARVWDAGDAPEYPHSPIILWGATLPESVLIDPLEAVITKEVNGEEKFELTIDANHKYAALIKSERFIQVAGEKYRTRRIEKERGSDGLVDLAVYAEAEFYDLATKAKVAKKEWKQVNAGDVMTLALKNTGWTVGVVNVTALRTYETDELNPLELLRVVQEHHGGDLVFDNPGKRVSLVVEAGHDNGVAFFYGKGLSQSKRVEDTTALVTRLYVKNADGLTIANLNDGKPYLEDYSFSSDVKVATYDFPAGTSPFTMMERGQDLIAERAKPAYSYEVTVNDLSAKTGNPIDRFDVADFVTVVDEEVGISDRQRIVRMEYDIVSPWDSQITLASILREVGADGSINSGTLDTGSGVPTFDLVPYNLLLNGRFDNGLAHWASLGGQVVEGGVTGDYAVSFSGAGERWVEQTIHPDNRTAYALSFDLSSTGPDGWVPDVVAQVEVTYEDGSSETIDIELT